MFLFFLLEEKIDTNFDKKTLKIDFIFENNLNTVSKKSFGK
jgi:hypothetical protein